MSCLAAICDEATDRADHEVEHIGCEPWVDAQLLVAGLVMAAFLSVAFLALCFGFAKRLAEMGYRSDRSTTRVVLRAYDEPRLQVLLIATAVAALVAYAACAVAGPNSWIVISVRFAITGLGRHSALVRMREFAEDATKDIF